MAIINRQTLKNYFTKGGFAQEKNFVDLIDSMVNLVDDGIEKSIDFGLKLSPLKNNAALISFFNKISNKKPNFSLNLNESSPDKLTLNNENNKEIISFKSNGNIGVNNSNPIHNFDVKGTIGTQSLVGTYLQGEVPADGNWHNVITNLDDISAFQITASARGMIDKGYYAVIHAIALSTFGGRDSKWKINETHAYYEYRRNKIQLRWFGEMHNYGLQIRTRRNYKSQSASDEYKITFNILNLLP